jgi:hypothetical protein
MEAGAIFFKILIAQNNIIPMQTVCKRSKRWVQNKEKALIILYLHVMNENMSTIPPTNLRYILPVIAIVIVLIGGYMKRLEVGGHDLFVESCPFTKHGLFCRVGYQSRDMKNKHSHVKQFTRAHDVHESAFLHQSRTSAPPPNKVFIRGDGLYILAISTAKKQILADRYIGLLDADYKDQLIQMDEFCKVWSNKGYMQNATHVVVFCMGGTHRGDTLKLLRRELFEEQNEILLHFFRKYGMAKFLSIHHGPRNPYVYAYSLKEGKCVYEVSGSPGAPFCAKLHLTS